MCPTIWHWDRFVGTCPVISNKKTQSKSILISFYKVLYKVMWTQNLVRRVRGKLFYWLCMEVWIRGLPRRTGAIWSPWWHVSTELQSISSHIETWIRDLSVTRIWCDIILPWQDLCGVCIQIEVCCVNLSTSLLGGFGFWFLVCYAATQLAILNSLTSETHTSGTQ